MKSLDSEIHEKGYQYIAGIDEAGRGPWAGPVYTAAVILPCNHRITGLNDSKQLSAQAREKLFADIQKRALSFAITSVSPRIIDRINILEATKQGMKKAIQELKFPPDYILLDAINLNIPEIAQQQLIRGDSRSECIAAASILAKVSRDVYMKKMHEKYPQYGFAQHKGYGTKAHLSALKKYGPCPLHRFSFAPVKNSIRNECKE